MVRNWYYEYFCNYLIDDEKKNVSKQIVNIS